MSTTNNRDESTGNADNRPELRTTSGQEAAFAIAFKSRDEVIERLCLKVFGAAPVYSEIGVREWVESRLPTPKAERPTLAEIATGATTPKTMTTVNAVEEILGMKVHVDPALPPDTVVIMPPKTAERPARCPDCGAQVPTIFEHVDGCPDEGPGATATERDVLGHLADAWNHFNRLDGTDDETHTEFRQAIHRAQDIIAFRVARRVDPGLWR